MKYAIKRWKSDYTAAVRKETLAIKAVEMFPDDTKIKAHYRMCRNVREELERGASKLGELPYRVAQGPNDGLGPVSFW